MPTEPTHDYPADIETSRISAGRSPLFTAAVHLAGLVRDIRSAQARGECLSIPTEAADAVAGVATLAAQAAADKPTPHNPIFLAVYVKTTNSRNGNPRRGWYVRRIDGEPLADGPRGADGRTPPAWLAWVEEGYDGVSALHNAARGWLADRGLPPRANLNSMFCWTGPINVTPNEYRAAQKLPRFGGVS